MGRFARNWMQQGFPTYYSHELPLESRGARYSVCEELGAILFQLVMSLVGLSFHVW